MTDKSHTTTNQEELWIRFAATRDPAIRDQLVLQCLDLVQWVVNRMGITQGHTVDRDDLVGEGIIGLIDAIDRFEPDRGIALSTYAVHRIRGQVLDALRARDMLPRSARRRVRELQAAITEITSGDGEVPSEEQLAQRMNLSCEQVQQTLADASLEICSLDEPLRGSDSGYSLEDTLHAPEETEPAASYDGADLRSALGQALGQLPERQRLLLSLYYVEELTMKEIGQVLDVSESRVSQLHAQSVLSLRAIMKRDGYLMPLLFEYETRPRAGRNEAGHAVMGAAARWGACVDEQGAERAQGRAAYRPGAVVGLFVLLLGLAAMAILPWIALANGSGLTVYLGYLPEVTNWGNIEARGEAYVNVGEGYVRLQVESLPVRNDTQYEVWLVPAEDRQEMISVGTFLVDAGGAAQVEFNRQDLPVVEYRFLMVTAEPLPGPGTEPGIRRALAGVLPNTRVVPGAGGMAQGGSISGGPIDAASDADPAPIRPGTPAAAVHVGAPKLLPVTGADEPLTGDNAGITFGLLIVVGLSLVGWHFAAHPRKGERP